MLPKSLNGTCSTLTWHLYDGLSHWSRLVLASLEEFLPPVVVVHNSLDCVSVWKEDITEILWMTYKAKI